MTQEDIRHCIWIGIKLSMKVRLRATGSQDCSQTLRTHLECVVQTSQAEVTGAIPLVLPQPSHYPLLQKVWYNYNIIYMVQILTEGT